MFSKCSHGLRLRASGSRFVSRAASSLLGRAESETTIEFTTECRRRRATWANPGCLLPRQAGEGASQRFPGRTAGGAAPCRREDRRRYRRASERLRSAPPPAGVSGHFADRGELRELRVRFAKTRYRVLYQRSRNLMVLLHVFEKNTGAVMAKDKRTAETRMADFEARMNASPRRHPRAAGRDAPPGTRGA